MARVRFEATSSEGGGSYTPLPQGTYDVQFSKIEETRSKNGNAQLQVTGRVAGGPHDNKVVMMWYSMTPKSGWKLENLLDATNVDFTAEDAEGGGSIIDFETDDLIGAYCRFNVRQREWDGKMRNDFNDEAVSPLSAQQDASLAQAAPAPAQAAAPASRREKLDALYRRWVRNDPGLAAARTNLPRRRPPQCRVGISRPEQVPA